MNLEKGTEIEILQEQTLLRGIIEKIESQENKQNPKIYFSKATIYEYCPNIKTTNEDILFSFQKSSSNRKYSINLNEVKDKIRIIKSAYENLEVD